MFRKAQLKLFGVITSILLAIFIIVLASINIVTRSFMQRESREVLRKIASVTEYDEKTNTFTFTPPDDFEPKRSEPPLEKPVQTVTDSTTEPTTETAETEEITEKQITEAPAEEETEEAVEIEEPDTEPEPEDLPEPEPETYFQEETVQPEEPSTEDIPPTEDNPYPPDRNEDDRPPDFPPDKRFPEDFPDDDNRFSYWRDPHNWNYEDYDRKRDDIFRQSYTDRNFSVIQLSNTVATSADAPSKKPDRDIFDHKKDEPFPKNFGSIDFFVIMADNNGNYLACMNNDDLTDENAQAYITEVLRQKHNTGMMDSYQFYEVSKDNGTLIALTDKSEEKKVMNQFIRTTIIIGALTLIVLSFVGYFLSRKSIEPIKAAFEKQKQFISDASHELKTPLTVISANADVLSGEIGENKWLNYIKSQTDRMNLLVNDLLSLTRLENNTSNFICTDFSLSQAVTNTALPFECRAFETNKKFIVDVEDNITINGSEQHIKQMTAIFIDNALKYSNDGGIVRVTLKKQNDRKILSVYNTGTGVKDSEKDKIFERFYRSDDSRTRQTIGGYGLGLAIAKSIIDKHKFKISVENVESKSISFVITM
ncbi:MAG: HAMP domain-containing histidine kinase [Ruminococcus sp.]|nr:HAMP domain-containing histidine kinase [Ruminococcus sp.]